MTQEITLDAEEMAAVDRIVLGYFWEYLETKNQNAEMKTRQTNIIRSIFGPMDEKAPLNLMYNAFCAGVDSGMDLFERMEKLPVGQTPDHGSAANRS